MDPYIANVNPSKEVNALETHSMPGIEYGTNLKKSQGSKPGTYGVSIRVQGIGGHPYVVLNNRDEQSKYQPSENSYSDTSLESSKTHTDTNGNKLKGRDNGEVVLPENPFAEPHRSQKQMQLNISQNGVSEFKDRPIKGSTLLNFQKHPELLQPYDPEKNCLNIDTYQSQYNKSPLVSDVEMKKNASSKLLPSNNMYSRPVESVKLNNDSYNCCKHVKDLKQVSKTESMTVGSTEVLKSDGGSQNISNSVSNQEPRKQRPDVLPLRRQESAGPVLEMSRSRRSSTSSTTPTSVGSLNKLSIEDQEDALYAEHVNRHENRRYIPFVPGTGRDIDTGSILGVDQLIDKFDGKDSPQRRGRSARRNRINPEDRKRSRSVDSAFPLGLPDSSDYLHDFRTNFGKSNERLLRPSQLRLQKSSPQDSDITTRDKLHIKHSFSSGGLGKTQQLDPEVQKSNLSLNYHNQNKYNGPIPYVSKDSLLGNIKKAKEEIKSISKVQLQPRVALRPVSGTGSTAGISSNREEQVTPDILKGQQELSQQTNEETAKQILFNYLKDGSSDNDDATKKKVNLVFEKIQTLKSRAAGSVQADDKQSSNPPADVRVLQEQKNELEREVSELKRKLEQETKHQQNIKEETDRTRANLKDLQQQLEESVEESNRLRERLSQNEKELRNNLEELFQVKMEREQYQSEIRDLQDQLSEMHDELDHANVSEIAAEEKAALLQELMQMKQSLQETFTAKEQQEELLRKRERELTALKGALKQEVSSHDQELDQLKEHYEKELQKLRKCVEETKQNGSVLANEKMVTEQMKNAAENQVKELMEENKKLEREISELEGEISKLKQTINDMKSEESQMKDKIKQLEAEKKQLENAMEDVGNQEQEMESVKRTLESRLEEVQRRLSKVIREHQDLTEKLKEEVNQKEVLKKTKKEMEAERWKLDKTIEKLQKEMAEIMDFSRKSTLELQNQLNEYKEKNRKEISDLQRQLKDKSMEVEKYCLTAKKLQDEIHHLERELEDCGRERDESVAKSQQLKLEVTDLKLELESKTHVKEDRSRQFKLMEEKVSLLEADLEEERSNVDQLTDRITRSKEQIEQMRNELLHEKAARQDLECDKIALERQNKDLKSRVAHLEGSQRSSKDGIVAQLELRIQELEERLECEERDRNNLQLANRRYERRVKELLMQVDDDHLTLNDQKDQLNLRLKMLKRKVDEAEEEIDKLENAKKKLQRELEEQMEANDQLQAQLNTLKKDLRKRKSTPTKILNDIDDEEEDDDDFSTDGDSLYGAASAYKLSRES
uniref:Cingulin like 1 n=1 Tax=Latimeria chalumnae TaxID=7897 RepID=H3B0D2_LATCH